MHFRNCGDTSNYAFYQIGYNLGCVAVNLQEVALHKEVNEQQIVESPHRETNCRAKHNQAGS
jgi:hypothetical protein